jgi:hypothetical protein
MEIKKFAQLIGAKSLGMRPCRRSFSTELRSLLCRQEALLRLHRISPEKCPETKSIKQFLKEFFECFREKAGSVSFALLILDNGDLFRILKKGFD